MAEKWRLKTLYAMEKVLKGETFLAVILKSAGFPPQYGRLLRGTVEREVTLTALLRKLSSVKPEKLRPMMRSALLLGLYELYFMDTPDYAVINETVELLKSVGLQSLTGYANAVLRTADREKESLVSGLRKSEKISLPETVFRIFSKAYGVENTMKTGAYFLSEEGKAVTVRRIQSNCTETEFLTALEKDGASAERAKLIPEKEAENGISEWETKDFTESDDFFVLHTDKPIDRLTAFHKGFFYVQDGSPYLGYREAEKFLSLTPEKSVLDLSASPGGKSLHLADILREKGFFFTITACDVTEEKLKRIEENKVRLGFPEIKTRVNDGTVFQSDFENGFDIVIADVPCSGLGDLSGKPDIKLHVTDESIGELIKIQGGILGNAGKYLKKGGVLLYSTCTLNPEENENRIRDFIQENTGFTKLFEKTYLPGVNVYGDGFYIAVLKKAD